MRHPDFTTLRERLREAAGIVAPAIQIAVRHRDLAVLDAAYGWIDPGTHRQPTTTETRFDLASVTKLFVVTAFMHLVESGGVAIEQPVQSVLPELTGRRPIAPYEDPLHPGQWVSVAGNAAFADVAEVTFRHLLTHTSGLPAWRPLYREPDGEAARSMALTTFFSYPPGTQAVYSDIGLILLGIAVERLTELPLDRAVAELVTRPLGLHHTGYIRLDPARLPAARPPDATIAPDVAPTECCNWRRRRIVGEVHDENAWRLGGVAGHAGIFATARDVATLGQMYLDGCNPGRAPQPGDGRLSSETVTEMRRLHTPGLALRRGLGFALWSRDPEASGNPFGEAAFGHTGFTGTSLWIDPERELVVALLTNEVYNGRTDRRIAPFRVAAHRAVVEAVDRSEADT